MAASRDAAFARCVLVADALRVACSDCSPTVAEMPWARHDRAYARAFEDLVVSETLASSKPCAADRYAITWRAADNACGRVAEEVLGPVPTFSTVLASLTACLVAMIYLDRSGITPDLPWQQTQPA